MKIPPSYDNIPTPLNVESNVFVTFKDISVHVRADGKYVVLSGNILRALFSLRNGNGVFRSFLGIVGSADSALSYVDINICLYNERFAVMGPETKPVVNWAKSAILRFFNNK